MRFREYHTKIILDQFDFRVPLDRFLNHYFRTHKAIGSKDRKEIGNTVYQTIRSQGPVAADPETLFPIDLLNLITASHGDQKGKEICRNSNTRAPATIRLNPLKAPDREEVYEKWKPLYPIHKCSRSILGLSFHEPIHFQSMQEFQEGWFEVQDEGSQLIADLINPLPGQSVLDYCAGAGGKALAFAYKLKKRGQIFLHDIRPHALSAARRRCQRAGIQNIQFSIEGCRKEGMDWILVDVPCSGTGTLRRNPDLKWKFSLSTLERLRLEQQEIFAKALQYLHPKGKIVYATCSLLREENQEQVSFFIKQHSLRLEQELSIVTGEDQMDGFYGAILTKV